MSAVDERTERLIVRLLDGELRPAEQDELNRTLLRSAEARRLLSEYQENDRLATDVIEAAVEGTWAGGLPARHVRRVGLWAGVTTGLAAAAAIAIIVAILSQRPSPGPIPMPGPAPEMAQSEQPIIGPDRLRYSSMDWPYQGQRRIDRHYIAVLDETGESMLLFEVDRTRTVRLPLAGDL